MFGSSFPILLLSHTFVILSSVRFKFFQKTYFCYAFVLFACPLRHPYYTTKTPTLSNALSRKGFGLVYLVNSRREPIGMGSMATRTRREPRPGWLPGNRVAGNRLYEGDRGILNPQKITRINASQKFSRFLKTLPMSRKPHYYHSRLHYTTLHYFDVLYVLRYLYIFSLLYILHLLVPPSEKKRLYNI